MKKIVGQSALILLGAVIVAAASYFSYVMISYKRIEDNLPLDVISDQQIPSELKTNVRHRIYSANLGFGAYSDDYSFFMDGGKYSRAKSREDVVKNITGSSLNASTQNADIYLFQEVDLKGTRSYKINERDLVISILKDNLLAPISHSTALNFDSPYLLWPLVKPHGKNKSSIVTVSKAKIQSAERISLPIEEGMSKFIDLDRCYSKNAINVEGGKRLVVYNVHLSAYTTMPETAENQIIKLSKDMAQELDEGSYVIAGGDMNKNVIEEEGEPFGHAAKPKSWAVKFPKNLLDSRLTLVGPFDKENPVPSCRDCDIGYTPETFVVTVDGFIVSSNVKVLSSTVRDDGFRFSDHNPVAMDFMLID